MKTSNMTPTTREICPTTLKAGDQFMPMFNDNVYTVKNDFDPNTEGVFLEGPDYCGHCTFLDCPTVRLIEATPSAAPPPICVLRSSAWAVRSSTLPRR